jgi:hypothetical protein
MRAPLSLHLLVAALLASGGCASTPPSTDSSPAKNTSASPNTPQSTSKSPSASQVSTPQVPSETPSAVHSDTPPPAPQPPSLPHGDGRPNASAVTRPTSLSIASHVSGGATAKAQSGSASGSASASGTAVPVARKGSGTRGGTGNHHGGSSGKKSSSRGDPGSAAAHAGNGATARKIPERSGDDIVASRLRKAAEQEADPRLKERLWQEYADYRRNAPGR